MAFMTVKLLPGVHTEQSALLLQAGIISSNLIRFKDGLAEKLGGWVQAPFLSNPVLPGLIRALWAWEDFSSIKHLAAAGDAGLFVPTDAAYNITPKFYTDNVSPGVGAFSVTAGSNIVTVTDPNLPSITDAATVIFQSHLSIGGIILFGTYAVATGGTGPPTTYTFLAREPALFTVTSGGVASFATTAGSEIVQVTLPDHGLAVGGVFVLTLPQTLTGSGIVLQGLYTVLSVLDVNNFTIGAQQIATASVSGIFENGGNVALTYWTASVPPSSSIGWGEGGWGEYGWGGTNTGISPPLPGQPVTKTSFPWPPGSAPSLDWSLTNFGQTLIALPEGGPFFQWDPTSGASSATEIPTAPIAANGFFLAMPQQQLVAYGASLNYIQDPMLVRWSDNADYTDWVATVSNQAGSYRLTRGSRIVGGIQAPQQAMLWTDVGFWLMTYIGYPDVWGFAEVAQGCGLIAKKAVCVVGTNVMWMGINGFWTYSGGQTQKLPCEVWDAIYQNLDTDPEALKHIRCAANSGFDEFWCFFPSLSGAGENDSYVKRNMVSGEWDYGTFFDPVTSMQGGLPVSDWQDANIYGAPISAMSQQNGTSLIVQQETGFDADGPPGAPAPLHWWFKTGLFLLAEGEVFVFVDRMYPDFKWSNFKNQNFESSTVKITLYTQNEPDNPNSPPAAFGPFLCTNSSGPVDPRARGRYFSALIEGNDLGSFTRMGGLKFRFSPDGQN